MVEGYVVEARKKIETAFKGLNINLSDEQADQFYQYYRMLIEWNEKINLTAITDFNQVLLKHFIDSCALCKIMDIAGVDSLIDVGTGAGFPGLPLKILFPHLKVTLLDSLNKRIFFLNHVIKELDLQEMETIHGRAEEIGHQDKYREKYDLCVSRAVANLSVLMEYCIPFVKVGGLFVSYKSDEINEETELAGHAAEVLHCRIDSIQKMTLPESDVIRSFVMIKKTEALEDKYPRRAGLPAKKPL